MSVISLKTRQKYGTLLAGNPFFVPPSFESLATFTLGTDTASVTFSSIPSTFQHLQIRINARGTRSAVDCRARIRFNSDTGSNYTHHYLVGDGSAASAAGAASQTFIDARDVSGNTATSNIFGSSIIDLHDYASTTKNKTVRGVTGVDRNGTGTINVFSGLWINTNAVNTILIYPESNNWLAGSTFALYGIKGA